MVPHMGGIVYPYVVNLLPLYENINCIGGYHMKKSVLIVEDGKRMRTLLVDYFEEDGFIVYTAADGIEALQQFDKHEVDLIILDIMMPKLDGYSVCQKIRQKSKALIIMLTAREEEDDKLLGFELGADEYVTKPFSMKVLMARANTLLNRFVETEKNELSEKYIEYESIKIYQAGRKVMYSNEVLELTNKEYDLILLFVKNNGIVLTRDHIIDHIWGYDYIGDGRIVDTNVKTLRKKLREHAKWIKTIKGIGYKFEVTDDEV